MIILIEFYISIINIKILEAILISLIKKLFIYYFNFKIIILNDL